ncbi:hypothetical protein [Streptomyces radicis]|uniref:Uncharacterized protein n=1 Tax=Streptomyces radicis TaxID=1750517 RepID=A0A3A9W281_9ACTN|nr:hypothetical protein [Streptomyces radicis]RKN07070.1 hypothetical protein D7319_20495 [Streptomyces radicis]RKN15130.1 hypothetical protein D7318_28365 [Streptomyces radicis]
MTLTTDTTHANADPTTRVRATPVEVSRHVTSEGTVRWTRCPTCGGLRMALTPDDPRTAPLVSGGHAPDCPDSP